MVLVVHVAAVQDDCISDSVTLLGPQPRDAVLVRSMQARMQHVSSPMEDRTYGHAFYVSDNSFDSHPSILERE
ncbi:hypothetical protein SHKM778_82400 [Streptomyces sp. KM77-8]|uniref:Uncharacterized protein n=1 Tax=Streptomyces haneummycinicus TaxID=3074435 RepID=A0AAT9HWI6_9ACTN